MKKKSITIIAVLLVISIGNYFRIIANGGLRTVEFISIFAMGMLSGILVVQVVMLLKNKKE